MIDLQIGLIVGGLIIILAVYGLNWWQELRYKKTAAKAFANNHPDILLSTPKNMVRHGMDSSVAQRYEPSFVASSLALKDTAGIVAAEEDTDPVFARNYAASADTFIRTEETLASELDHIMQPEKSDLPEEAVGTPLPEDTFSIHAETVDAPEHDASAPPISTQAPYQPSLSYMARMRSSDTDRDISLNPAFYFIAEVYAQTPIDAASMPILRAAKRVRCLGLRADKQWEVVTDGSLGRYDELKIGLQLVDRQGPLTLDDINAFCQTIQVFVDEYEASVVFSQRLQKCSQANDLDQFCAATDVQIGLNLSANTDLSLEKIAAFAAQEKMTLAADGAFHLTDESGNTLFSLINQNGQHFTPNCLGETRAISFVLDVPRVANGGEVFDHMCTLAQQLAEALRADLVDDKQQTLTEQNLMFIRHELVHLQDNMRAKDIVAGSSIALQLYA